MGTFALFSCPIHVLRSRMTSSPGRAGWCRALAWHMRHVAECLVVILAQGSGSGSSGPLGSGGHAETGG